MRLGINRRYKWGIILFFLIEVGSLPAQHIQINTRKFTTEDGLSHNTIYSIIQDRQGYLWGKPIDFED